MDRILNRIHSVKNHPISRLDNAFRIKYAKGLGACLYVLSGNSLITKMLYQPWANSIISNASNLDDYWTKDLDAAKSALSIQHKGLRFFTMRYSLLYDLFYLLEHSFLPQYSSRKPYVFLKENLCLSPFAKKALDNVYNHFVKSVVCTRIDNSLTAHRYRNNLIFTQKEKKILIVANVSAGKSTLINALVGYRISKTKTTACTNRLIVLHNKTIEDGFTLKEANNSYRHCSNICETDRSNIAEAAFAFRSSLAGERVCFVDTPGVNNAEETNHRQITEEAIANGDYDAVMYISNGKYFGTNDEHQVLQLLKEKVKKPILFVLNQLDNFVPEEDSIDKMLSDYKTDILKFGFQKPVVIPVSAYAAFLFKTDASLLSKVELRKLKTLNELFDNDYYDLPAYIDGQRSKDKLSKTGIIKLENTILTI